VALHELERLRDRVRGRERHRLDDHPRLRALHLVDLGNLVLDREVAMDDAETALARERDREARLGHGVHRGRDERDVQCDRRRQAGDSRDVVRQHARLRRDEEDVVEGEALLAELPLERDEALDLLLPELGLHHATLAACGDGDQERTGWSSESSMSSVSVAASESSNRPAPTSLTEAAPAATAIRTA